MAQKRKSSSSSRSKSNKRKSTSRSRSQSKATEELLNEELINEISMIVVLGIALLLFLCNFKILGTVGNAVSDVLFGLFGFMNYIVPLLGIYMMFFGAANKGNPKAIRRNGSLIALYLLVSVAFELAQNEINANAIGDVIKDSFMFAYENHKGGGVIAGLIAYLGVKALGTVGTILLLVVLIIIVMVILTEKSFINGVKGVAGTSKKAVERSAESARTHSERFTQIQSDRKRHAEEVRRAKEEEKKLQKEQAENDKILKRTEVSGVPTYNFISEEEVCKERDDIHEINLTNLDEEYEQREITNINFHGVHAEETDENDAIHEIRFDSYSDEELIDPEEDDILIQPEDNYVDPYADEDAPTPIKRGINSSSIENTVTPVRNSVPASGSIFRDSSKAPTNGGRTFGTESGTASDIKAVEKKKPVKPYKKPPIDLLKKGENSKNGDKNELMNTAHKLEQVLESFNVKARVTDVSQGPAVTRYEMIPETGVKVSKILSLQDDLKLNLAAADIRIEAPIPGKAAIGIEVPNKESASVALRDLIDSKEFKASESKISFAVGKDLSGKVVVTDIAKMPHMLIAGATGSGKSVCINTLIMSILYKATPQEVKLIMIDPKVVELSVYNGIPHLLIPVVTDPKKANASLAWAVREMDDRYQKFAEYGVRDLKGYNSKIENEKDINGNPIPKMFQLVVIVDELADLMMVAGKEVEESICRLAQLARAAGIHLIIATQRPSVDVITGLIKANMPSRVAFSVSSGTDSRTILDMVGAEKLLGKGDMLFYPQGYTKPARVQGAFVSDKEVSDVVDFLKSNGGGYEDTGIDFNQVVTTQTTSNVSSGGSSDTDDGQDEFFYEAGKLITESGKCSIGMLQRKFKIGFNRAARIMDALSDANVVGPEEGTKPRTILMTPEQFEEYINS